MKVCVSKMRLIEPVCAHAPTSSDAQKRNALTWRLPLPFFKESLVSAIKHGMLSQFARFTIGARAVVTLVMMFTALGMVMLSLNAEALPSFARQTGQNCVACHAGGQFPMLTPYGRKFKLTGYTIGSRTWFPVALMIQAGATRVANATNGSSSDPNGSGGNGGSASDNFPKNGLPYVGSVSAFVGGKITDNIGLFGQWTYSNYDHQGDDGRWHSHSSTDQFDLRYADRFTGDNRDLIIGASLNNNVGTTDVWNTFNSPFQIVPTPIALSSALQPNVTYGPINKPLISSGLVAAGTGAYMFWDNFIYLELGGYRSANGVFSFMSQGIANADTTKLRGTNPYLRMALNHEWGAHSAMIGLHGLNAAVYSDPTDLSSPLIKSRDIGIDGQYQYILDPHTVSAQFSYTHENKKFDDALWNTNNPSYLGAAANSSARLNYIKLNGTYIYHATYGTSLSFVSVSGSADNLLYPTQAFGYANNTPNTRVWIPEVFWTPIQHLRLGAQYYHYTQYNGGRANYDGTSSRAAKDNDTLFVYAWVAY
jgi:hypothetical protein